MVDEKGSEHDATAMAEAICRQYPRWRELSDRERSWACWGQHIGSLSQIERCTFDAQSLMDHPHGQHLVDLLTEKLPELSMRESRILVSLFPTSSSAGLFCENVAAVFGRIDRLHRLYDLLAEPMMMPSEATLEAAFAHLNMNLDWTLCQSIASTRWIRSTIVVLGALGGGKSALASRLLGHTWRWHEHKAEPLESPPFATRPGLAACTGTPMTKQGHWFGTGCPITVIDTPAFDTNTVAHWSLPPAGSSPCYVLCFHVGNLRQTLPVLRDILAWLVTHADDALQRTVVAITHCDPNHEQSWQEEVTLAREELPRQIQQWFPTAPALPIFAVSVFQKEDDPMSPLCQLAKTLQAMALDA